MRRLAHTEHPEHTDDDVAGARGPPRKFTGLGTAATPPRRTTVHLGGTGAGHDATSGGSAPTPIELYYEDHGAGRPVVLIHGWPLSSRSWEAQVPALVDDGYRVITYDRRGFGQSSQPWEGYDYDTFADDLDQLLTTLDLSEVTLVGFSMGGGEVARYVGRYGTTRIAKAVFAAAVPPYLYQEDGNPEGGFDQALLTSFHDGIRADRLGFVEGFVTNFFAVKGRTELVSPSVRAYNTAIAAFASPKGTLDCTTAFTKTDFRDDLKAFTIPTLVIHGDSDAIVPFEISGKRAAEAIPDSRLVLVEDAPTASTSPTPPPSTSNCSRSCASDGPRRCGARAPYRRRITRPGTPPRRAAEPRASTAAAPSPGRARSPRRRAARPP
ncbi:alpha/beta hydrolase [Amycolatopsis sp. NPDC023774]|uniref:alpha/beta fold hydrolase n=1 Tax=Amycolatopsis sp. NPDC023774 TaxID=3155015 RepID=UPI003401560B